MKYKEIAYITYARMPTEKAHGLQIHKMCEAYCRQGCSVTLVVPTLKNPIKQESYYQPQNSYKTAYLRMPDFIFLASVLGFWAYRLNIGIFLIRLLIYRPSKKTLILTRTPEIAWLFKKRGYTVVCEIHDWPQSWQEAFLFLLKEVDLLVCNSPGVAQEFNECNFLHTMVAHNGVDVDDFQVSITKHEAKKRLSLPVDKKVVMYIGSLEGWKGVDTLLEASNNLPTQYIVVIIGGPNHRATELQKLYPKVLFLFQRPYKELPLNQKAADLLIVPNSPDSIESQKYTSPIKLFAHLLSGVPILVSRLSSMESIVSEREVYFFTAGNVTVLTEKIEEVFDNYQDALIRAKSAESLGKTYSWDRRSSEILDALYNRLRD